jgi:ABC-type polysaccharide/polyol phosphate transport system ATPase subunit
MDEWISAGDARFLEKAHKRMADLIGSSNIMVLASHSMPLLREVVQSRHPFAARTHRGRWDGRRGNRRL